jgi:hypothetical protein
MRPTTCEVVDVFLHQPGPHPARATTDLNDRELEHVIAVLRKGQLLAGSCLFFYPSTHGLEVLKNHKPWDFPEDRTTCYRHVRFELDRKHLSG